MRSQLVLVSLLGLAVGCGDDPGVDMNSKFDAGDPQDGGAAHDGGAHESDAGELRDGGGQGGCSADGSCAGDAASPCEPDGSGEICDGVDNDCDPTTPDGAEDPLVGEPCDGEDGDLCAEGVTACSAGARSCGDASDDNLDACDGLDNDCDGTIDQACTEAPFPIADFALAGDGSAAAVGAEGKQVKLMCFGPDGSVVRDAFTAAGPEVDTHNLLSMEVARSRQAKNVTVAVTYRPTNEDWRNYVAFFGPDCELVAGPQVLDSELANTGLNRRLGVRVSDDGTSYVLYEHDAEKKFRVLVFDSQGQPSADVTLARPSECAGDGRPGKLVLNDETGDFGVFCEGGSTRNFRRFGKDGTPLDGAIRAVPDSAPDGFSFHYWSAAMNRDGAFLYFGRNAAAQWLVQPYDQQGGELEPTTIQGATGVGAPQVAETSQGNFLVELAGQDYQLALMSPAGAVLRHWPQTLGKYRVDAQDHVYVIEGRAVVRSSAVALE